MPYLPYILKNNYVTLLQDGLQFQKLFTMVYILWIEYEAK